MLLKWIIGCKVLISGTHENIFSNTGWPDPIFFAQFSAPRTLKREQFWSLFPQDLLITFPSLQKLEIPWTHTRWPLNLYDSVTNLFNSTFWSQLFSEYRNSVRVAVYYNATSIKVPEQEYCFVHSPVFKEQRRHKLHLRDLFKPKNTYWLAL